MVQTLKFVILLLTVGLCNGNPMDQSNGGQSQLSGTELLEKMRECVKSSFNSRFHNETQQCYEIGSAGPCGNNTNMIFLTEDSEEDHGHYGSCQCKQARRITAYYSAHGRCYSVYDQGYCPEGYFLSPAHEDSAEIGCQENTCFQPGVPDLIPFEGDCVEIGSRCDTESAEDEYDTYRRKRIQIGDDGYTLFCGYPNYSAFSIAGIVATCPRGTYTTRYLTCRRVIFNADDW